ncbi:MAG: HlyD family type I secretion periplasmic adaptor subunit [Maritimibacter sp.]|nr:HlyD family type I secretion periplasmic adaptor subunit [Maritimibacter sp.]
MPWDGDEALPRYRPVLIAALAVAVAFTLALLGWGMLARLDAAIVSHGVLHSDSERKTVEHLEGGILSELLVRPGEMVEAGQIVARLDDTQPREALAQLEAEADAIGLAQWRLAAEEAGFGLDPATAPETFAADPAPLVAQTLQLFEARLSAHRAQIAALERQIDQLGGDTAAAEGGRAAAETQLASWQDERELVADLVARGATPRQKLLDYDRNIAALTGQRDEYAGEIEAARQGIARARAEIDALDQQRRAEIAQTRAEARTRATTLAAQIRATEDVIARHVLRAPQAGRVVTISTVTPGAVLGSGQPLMEILPRDDRLVALVKLPPDAIDTVHVGQPARLLLTAYKRSTAPKATGSVAYVSADLLTDEQTGVDYFEARVTLDPDSLAELDGVLLTAGMPVEVSLTIGERRAGDYLLEPLLRHLRKAFREE